MCPCALATDGAKHVPFGVIVNWNIEVLLTVSSDDSSGSQSVETIVY
jgi:hypothetical protein